MCMKLGCRIYIDHIVCVIRSMSDVEFPMHFESAHSVPNFVKFLHFVTYLLIAYDGPEHYSLHGIGLQTKDHTSNVVGV